MEEILRTASEHHLLAIAVVFAFLLALYFLLKSLMKVALFVLIIVILIGGYCYFERPGRCPSSLDEVLSKTKSGSGKVAEDGQDAWKKGKALIGEGREAYEKGKKKVMSGNELLRKGIERMTVIVEKVKKKAQKILRYFVAEDDGPKRQSRLKERSPAIGETSEKINLHRPDRACRNA